MNYVIMLQSRNNSVRTILTRITINLRRTGNEASQVQSLSY